MLMIEEQSCFLLIDVQEKLTPQILNAKAMVARCEWLLELSAKRGVPVIVSEQYPKGLGKTLPNLINSAIDAHFIEKNTFSCMGESGLNDYLKKLNKSHIIIAGIETHVCVMQSALELKAAGFQVFVVVDAVSSRNAIDTQYALKRMKQAGIHLVTAEMVFFEWIRVAGNPEFKALSKAFLQ
jgi:nicotinamidase-related amidase